MSSSDFAYWLNGFAELHGSPPTPAQWEMIKEHLGLVFNKVTTKSIAPDQLYVRSPGGSPAIPHDQKICAPLPTYCDKAAEDLFGINRLC